MTVLSSGPGPIGPDREDRTPPPRRVTDHPRLTFRRYRAPAMSRRLRLPAALAAVAIAVTLTACGSSDDDASGDPNGSAPADTATDISLVPATQPSVPDVVLPETTPTELVTTVITEGSGTPAAEGDTVFVQYVGVRSEDGAQFDTNYGGDPFPVTLGSGGVIPGWDEGLVGTTAGERLQLDIP